MEWLLVQGIALLIKPMAEQALATFTKDLAERAGRAGSSWVVDWIGQLATGPAESQEALVKEAAAHPEEVKQLSTDLQERFGITLPTAVAEAYPPGSDGYVLDAYHAVLWRVAAMAWWSRRTIVIEGALQGQGWLLACYPTGRFESLATSESEWSVPDMDGVWYRSSDSLYVPPHPQAEFWVRRVADDEARRRELLDFNADFHDDPGRPTFDERAPLEERWLSVDGIHATWVHLRPDVPAFIHMKKLNSIRYSDFQHIQPRLRDYPPEWQALARIEDPAIGLAAILAGADALAQQDATSREKIGRLLQRE